MIPSAQDTIFERRNLVATFDGMSRARQAARTLTSQLHHARVEVRPKEQQIGVQYAEMRDEMEGVVASPVLGSAMNRTQFQGALVGVAVVGGIAVALGLLIGLVVAGPPGSDGSAYRWLLTWLLVPAAAGGTLGMLAGGMLKPRRDPARAYEADPSGPAAQQTDGEEVSVQVSTDSEQDFLQAMSMLRELNPRRLDRLNARGEVQATKETGQGRSDSEGTPPGRTDI